MSEQMVNASLLDLIQRAERSGLSKTTNKRNKALLKEMSFTIVALAERIAQLQEQIADKPLIVTP